MKIFAVPHAAIACMVLLTANNSSAAEVHVSDIDVDSSMYTILIDADKADEAVPHHHRGKTKGQIALRPSFVRKIKSDAALGGGAADGIFFDNDGGSIIAPMTTMTQTSEAHVDTVLQYADRPGVPRDDKVGFVFLTTNDDAHFDVDDTCIPALKNRLVLFDGAKSVHRTIVERGRVHLLGPFHVKTFAGVGSTQDCPSDASCSSNYSGAIITNGQIKLGVHPSGSLVTRGTILSAPGTTTTTDVGLRYIFPTGTARAGQEAESISFGCSEGWGARATKVAGSQSTVYGFANQAAGCSIGSYVPFLSTSINATSIVTIPSGTLEVTHDFHPSGATAKAYEVEVTLRNLVTVGLTDVRYRRVMDWSIWPQPSEECVTIGPDPLNAAALIGATNTDFNVDMNQPLSVRNAVQDVVPGEGRGATFDFKLRDLARSGAPGDKVQFKLFYGAAENKPQAMDALDAVGAEVYSLGKTHKYYERCDDDSVVFFFGFSSAGSESPSSNPSSQPSSSPSNMPSLEPSSVPSSEPNSSPSSTPSTGPSSTPSFSPSSKPSSKPSSVPSDAPSSAPSSEPSKQCVRCTTGKGGKGRTSRSSSSGKGKSGSRTTTGKNGSGSSTGKNGSRTTTGKNGSGSSTGKNGSRTTTGKNGSATAGRNRRLSGDKSSSGAIDKSSTETTHKSSTETIPKSSTETIPKSSSETTPKSSSGTTHKSSSGTDEEGCLYYRYKEKEDAIHHTQTKRRDGVSPLDTSDLPKCEYRCITETTLPSLPFPKDFIHIKSKSLRGNLSSSHNSISSDSDSSASTSKDQIWYMYGRNEHLPTCRDSPPVSPKALK